MVALEALESIVIVLLEALPCASKSLCLVCLPSLDSGALLVIAIG